MSVRVDIHPMAERDIADISSYIIDRNLDAGRRFPDAVDRMLKHLAAFPLIGRERPDVAAGLRSLPVHDFKNYILFYRVHATKLEVIRVLHAAMNLKRQFER